MKDFVALLRQADSAETDWYSWKAWKLKCLNLELGNSMGQTQSGTGHLDTSCGIPLGCTLLFSGDVAASEAVWAPRWRRGGKLGALLLGPQRPTDAEAAALQGQGGGGPVLGLSFLAPFLDFDRFGSAPAVCLEEPVREGEM